MNNIVHTTPYPTAYGQYSVVQFSNQNFRNSVQVRFEEHEEDYAPSCLLGYLSTLNAVKLLLDDLIQLEKKADFVVDRFDPVGKFGLSTTSMFDTGHIQLVDEFNNSIEQLINAEDNNSSALSNLYHAVCDMVARLTASIFSDVGKWE